MKLNDIYTLAAYGDKKALELGGGNRIAGWCTLPEANLLYAILKAHGTVEVYESGTCNGWSASWMALAMKEVSGKVHTWDIESKPLIYKGTSLEDRITQHIGKFHEGVGSVIKNRDVNSRIAIFIDGAHGYQDCMDDLNAVKKWLRVNDLIIFHDTRKFDGIDAVFEELCKDSKYEGINFHMTTNGISVVRKKHKG